MTALSPPSANRAPWFWAGCLAISAGVLLHLPMLVEAHAMGNRLAGMAVDPPMVAGMALILAGVAAACWGALPRQRVSREALAGVAFAAPDDTPLNRWHGGLIAVLVVALVIDVMKPATLGFVLPGLADEYGIARPTAALLPLVALTGTVVGSFLWGWLADAFGRRVAIMLSTILFASTSICGAMPSFQWNLVMCFLMGSSAGGMLPVVYTLLAEIMPPRHRSWVLVLVGGVGLVGGYLAAAGAAHLLEPHYGWRSLWLQGFPTAILLLAMARLIPESPAFLHAQGQHDELDHLTRRFGIVRVGTVETPQEPQAIVSPGLGAALVVTALSWSFINFGLLLWLPMDLHARGYDAGLASGILASSSLLALPTIMVAAVFYSRISRKWTLIGTILLTVAGLAAAMLPAGVLASRPVLIVVVAALIVGTNGIIAVLLPYTAECYPASLRARATGLVAGASKFGGIAVQLGALAGFVPTLGGAAMVLLVPTALSAALIGARGRDPAG